MQKKKRMPLFMNDRYVVEAVLFIIVCFLVGLAIILIKRYRPALIAKFAIADGLLLAAVIVKIIKSYL